MIEVRPGTLEEVNDAIRRWHRHHQPVRRKVVCACAYDRDALVGAVAVETCRARPLMSPTCFEVTRLAVMGGGDS